jgi:hypothetical protein
MMLIKLNSYEKGGQAVRLKIASAKNRVALGSVIPVLTLELTVSLLLINIPQIFRSKMQIV